MARAEGFEEHLEGVEEVSSHGCGVGMCRARLEGGVRCLRNGIGLSWLVQLRTVR
jgi:hypothetical protein